MNSRIGSSIGGLVTTMKKIKGFRSCSFLQLDAQFLMGHWLPFRVLEEQEFGDLQGLLFMFSVFQEGSRFDVQKLKKFRVLQAAKEALIPYVKSRTPPPLPSRPHSSSSSRPSTTATAANTSPGRTGGMLGHNASAISLMLGLGSYMFLFPGQCTPVMLFVFVDDFSDNSTANYMEESVEASSLNHASSSSNLAKPTLPRKGSASVVVFARPASKSEGGFRKKLQSSLEAQIRFLIKKCLTLSGSEGSHGGSRSASVSNSAPLFSLDASRAVVLLDRSTNKRGESLVFATGLVEDVLNGKATSDSFLLETHGQSSNKEDLSSLKEFIYRQSDILRGRGGLANTNSGLAAGVGMVAVAAAAASTASAKTLTTASTRSSQLSSVGRSSRDPKTESNADVQLKKANSTENCYGETETAVENPKTPMDISKLNGNKFSFGRGLPNFTMKKPFSEVVAGSAAADLGFPPLQQRKQPLSGLKE